MSLKNKLIFDRCIARTQLGDRCCRKSKQKFLCKQHYDIMKKESLNCKNNTKNQVGGMVMLPACLDILQCNWWTDITSAVPGLSSVIGLLSLK